MPTDEGWAQFTAADWDAFAQSWIAELRGDCTDSEDSVGDWVVWMNFTATPDQQWQLILAAVAHASDEELGHIAAGPMEHLLGWHGESFIDEVERRADSDPKFRRMLLHLWQYKMSDEVWTRLKALKESTSSDED